jgi:hypothetical protein
MDKDADVERAIGLERRRWAEVDEALSERTAALSEEQRQIRVALVEYFSILQEWAHQEKATTGRAAAKHAPPGPSRNVQESDDVRRSSAQGRRRQAKTKSARF